MCYDASALVSPGGFAISVNVGNPDESGTETGEGTEEDTETGLVSADNELIELFVDIYQDLEWYSEDYADSTKIPYAHMDCDVYVKELSAWMGSADEYADVVIQGLMDCYETIQEYEGDKTDTAKLVDAEVNIEMNMAMIESYLADQGMGTDDVQPSPTSDPADSSPSPTSTKGGLIISMAPSGRWEGQVIPNTTTEDGVTLEQIDSVAIVFRDGLAYFGSSMSSSDDIVAQCEAWKAGIATYEVGAGEITFTIDETHNDINEEYASTITCPYDGSTITMEDYILTQVADY